MNEMEKKRGYLCKGKASHQLMMMTSSRPPNLSSYILVLLLLLRVVVARVMLAYVRFGNSKIQFLTEGSFFLH